MTLKRPILFIFTVLFLLMLFSPLYMYFSHNVGALRVKYPHILKEDEFQVIYHLKKGKPSHWVDFKNISPHVRWAIVLSEDWSFFQHQGIDVRQIKAALSDMMSIVRFRGASTITQQMVKNIFLSEERSVWRKIHEIVLAQKVEKVLTKERILEAYLNSIEYGPGIYGIKKASYHYFNKHPSELNPREGAFMAMLLPSPKRYYASFTKKSLTRFAKARIKAILRKMKMGHVITHEQFVQAISSKYSWEIDP